MSQITESRVDIFLRTSPKDHGMVYTSPTCTGADRKWHEFLTQCDFNPQTGEIRDLEHKVVAQYFDADVTGISDWIEKVPDRQRLRVLVFNPEGHIFPDVWTHEHNAMVLVNDRGEDKALLTVLRKQGEGDVMWSVHRPVRRGSTIDYQQDSVLMVQNQLAQMQAQGSLARIQLFEQWHKALPQPFITYGR